MSIDRGANGESPRDRLSVLCFEQVIGPESHHDTVWIGAARRYSLRDLENQLDLNFSGAKVDELPGVVKLDWIFSDAGGLNTDLEGVSDLELVQTTLRLVDFRCHIARIELSQSHLGGGQLFQVWHLHRGAESECDDSIVSQTHKVGHRRHFFILFLITTVTAKNIFD